MYYIVCLLKTIKTLYIYIYIYLNNTTQSRRLTDETAVIMSLDRLCANPVTGWHVPKVSQRDISTTVMSPYRYRSVVIIVKTTNNRQSVSFRLGRLPRSHVAFQSNFEGLVKSSTVCYKIDDSPSPLS